MSGTLPRCSLVTCARWESDAITEWIVYHRSIGFDHVYLYCNDDDPQDLYSVLLPFTIGDHPYVTFVHFPYAGVQTQMYKHFLRHFANRAEWFIMLDVDEFVVLRRDGLVSDFLQRFRDFADFVFINWLFFGHSNHKTRAAGSVLLNYTWRERSVNHFTKIFVNARCLDIDQVIATKQTGFWHSWDWFDDTRHKRAVNVLGHDMSGYYQDFPSNARAYLDVGNRQEQLLQTAVINHYAFRSQHDIARRVSRGMAGDFNGQRGFQKVLEEDNQHDFLQQFMQVQDLELCDYWRFLKAKSHLHTIGQPVPGPNLALNKPASQSSVSQWSVGKSPDEDARRVVTGAFSAAHNNHTDAELNPWWMVDLEAVEAVREIRIFNRVDQPLFRARAARFILESSADGQAWLILADRSETPCDFGGTDGHPYIWRSLAPCPARYIRFRLSGGGILHLNAVEVYEHPAPEKRLNVSAYGSLARTIAMAQCREPNKRPP